MIDIRPLVIAHHNSKDDDEKQLLKQLAHDCALDLPHPSTLYESGDAKKILSPTAFKALQEVMRSVYQNRKKVERVVMESRKQGWCVVCALPTAEKGEGCNSKAKKAVPNKGKGKRELRERSRPQRPRSCTYGFAGYPKISRTTVLRRTRGVGVKIADPSSSDEEIPMKEEIKVKEEVESEDSSDDVEIFGDSSGSGSESASECPGHNPLIVLSSDESGDSFGVDFPGPPAC